MYNRGHGVPQSEAKSAQWFKKAAAQGNADAQGFLGVMYLAGRGVIRDQEKGCALLRESAEQGLEKAIEIYNEVCAEGENKQKGKRRGQIPKGTTYKDEKQRLEEEIARIVKNSEDLGRLQ